MKNEYFTRKSVLCTSRMKFAGKFAGYEKGMVNYMAYKPLILLAGPTSVGKTALSVKLAKAIGGEIISSDSMQVYRYMDIGTAKIKPEEMCNVPHYLINEVDPDEDFNVVKYAEFAKKYIKQIYSKGKIPILVGGTGFYIQAVLYDIQFTENESDESYRKELEILAGEKGSGYLHALLRKQDPSSADRIHPNNTKRIIRALEYIQLTGDRMSVHNEEQRKREAPYRFCYFVLNRDRAKLYENINIRVDRMIEDGLLDEVRGLRDRGFTRDLVSMQGLGYKEILAYLEGECTLEEAVETIKRDTRHYAKRQITWFKREKDAVWLDKDEYGSEVELLEDMLKILRDKQIGGSSIE